MHSGLPGLTEAGLLKDWLAAGRPPPQHGELSVGSVVPHSFVPHLSEVSSFLFSCRVEKNVPNTAVTCQRKYGASASSQVNAT